MTCPSCGGPTLETPTGLHLNPVSGRMGRVLKDGTNLTSDDIRNPAVRGYYHHFCPPTSTTNQHR